MEIDKRKTAVILLNLGGPLKEEDIRPFLFNFFMDEKIIGAPYPLRFLIAHYISRTRGRGAARKAYARLGFKSPLLENTQAQADALGAALGEGFKIFVVMRHSPPRAEAAAREIKGWGADQIILLPLYPQYSTTTTESAFNDWDHTAQAAGLEVPATKIESWYLSEGFIEASAENIRSALATAPTDARLLFSAHGLPEKVIARGDPYQRQCEETAAAIVKKLDAKQDWTLCYQSRVGPLKWIGPSTEEELKRAGREKKGVVVYPLAFVSEHVETLVEIDIEYREKAKEYGAPFFVRVPAAGIHPLFIDSLARLVLKQIQK